MKASKHKPDADRYPKLALRLKPEDVTHLNELRTALAGPVGEPSFAEVIRLALKELHAAKVAALIEPRAGGKQA